jgi:Phe-tRNA synthetase beta subunit B1 domain
MFIPLSEPEPHRVTAPAPTKRCGSLRLRLRNTGVLSIYCTYKNFFIFQIEIGANRYDLLCLEGLSRALKIFQVMKIISVADPDDF